MRTAADGRRYEKQQYNALQVGSGSIVFPNQTIFTKPIIATRFDWNQAGTCTISTRKNVYDAATGNSAIGSTFNNAPVKYSYKSDDAARVPSIVLSTAGPH